MRSNTGGFTLVEIVVAAAIISFSLVSMVGIASNSILYSRQSLDTYNASTMLQEGTEVVSMMDRNGWSTLSALTQNTPYYFVFSTVPDAWTLSTTPNTNGIFTRTVTFGPVSRDTTGAVVASGSGTLDTGTLLAKVTVSWQESGSTISRSVSSYSSNIF